MAEKEDKMAEKEDKMAEKYFITLFTPTGDKEQIVIVGTGNYVSEAGRLVIWKDDEVIFQTCMSFILKTVRN